jgi:hypothetical protein
MEQRIFLEKEIYELDDIDMGLCIVLTNGIVTDIKLNEECNDMSFSIGLYSGGFENLDGIRYYGIYELEEDIGCAYDNEHEDNVKMLNQISSEVNELYRKIRPRFESVLIEHEKKLEVFRKELEKDGLWPIKQKEEK